ncbi:MAG: acetyl-CoA acetyltransferase [Actinomycetota bacterium]|nr:acetyl-CoA acetyltransferase [Actinomycetota bacterium]
MSIDPRTPVLVGQGQIVNHIASSTDAREPALLIAEAIRQAATDASLDALPEIDALHIVRLLSWKYANPAFTVASLLGIKTRAHGITPHGGNMPQLLINKLALEIQRGELDIAIVAGGEASNSRARAHRENATLKWSESDVDTPTAKNIIDDSAMSSAEEIARKIIFPVQIYPMFESALRAAAKRNTNEHDQMISELWSRFSNVAATNDFAWSKTPLTPEQVRSVTPNNRMIGLPYRKAMNSNNQVDMAAALIICSVAKATQLGIPRDKWIFPIAGTDCHEHYYISNRFSFADTPAIKLGGEMVCELANKSLRDISLIDLYSCFPSAVQLGAQSLGLSLNQQLTITGGLSFAGGPWNNYVMHAIATMMIKLRQANNSSTEGFIWANGGYATKHSFGIYSAVPPKNGFRHGSPQTTIDSLGKRELATPAQAAASDSGRATVEAFTVMHDRDGQPETAIAATLLKDSRRAWATSTDPQVTKALCTGEWVGQQVTLDPSGTLLI